MEVRKHVTGPGEILGLRRSLQVLQACRATALRPGAGCHCHPSSLDAFISADPFARSFLPQAVAQLLQGMKRFAKSWVHSNEQERQGPPFMVPHRLVGAWGETAKND